MAGREACHLFLERFGSLRAKPSINARFNQTPFYTMSSQMALLNATGSSMGKPSMSSAWS
jgi:hypothetical protein